MVNVIVTKDRYTVDPLYQWDLNQTLTIYGLSLASVPEIHFSNEGMTAAIVRQSAMNDAGVISVDVPNSLLQKSSPISVYVCIYEGDTFKSLYKIVVPIKARTMPGDYTIMDNDGEVYSFNALNTLCTNLLAAYDDVDKKHAEAIANLKTSANTYAQTAKLIEEYSKELDGYESQLEEFSDTLREYTEQYEEATALVNEAVTPFYCVCSTTSDKPAKVAALDNYVLREGQTVRVKFEHFVMSGATLNINNTGAIPIYGNSAPLTDNVIIDGYVADLCYNGAQYDLLNPHIDGEFLTPLSGYNFYTSDNTFVVPAGITAIRVSACAAGIGRNAGEYLIDQIYNVSAGQQIELTIGSGNTVIGSLATLIAGSVSSATPTTKLGYAAGYSGGNGGRASTDTSAVVNGYGGYGGAFGYGGGGGGAHKSGTTGYAGGGGGGIGGAGGAASTGVTDVGAAGGTTGGAGGRAANSSNTNYANGGNATSGKIIYIGASNNLTKGGDGSIYGAGGGGGAAYNAGGNGGGGAAGGYGAGGGTCGGDRSITGQPSNGMVLIEWGGTIGE